MDDKVKELVEWVATKLYESQHPRIFHTFEELRAVYGGSAEAIRNLAREILSHPDLALIVDCECGGKGYEEGGDGAPSWHVVCARCCDTGKAVIPLSQALEVKDEH